MRSTPRSSVTQIVTQRPLDPAHRARLNQYGPSPFRVRTRLHSPAFPFALSSLRSYADACAVLVRRNSDALRAAAQTHPLNDNDPASTRTRAARTAAGEGDQREPRNPVTVGG
jgi:hypothetical protein